MGLSHRRTLQSASVGTDGSPDPSAAQDFGEYLELHVVLTVVQAGEGEGATLSVKHAPVNEEDAYLDFETPVEVDLTQVGTTWFQVASFTRWVCWFISGTVTSDAVVTLDLVAKR